MSGTVPFELVSTTGERFVLRSGRCTVGSDKRSDLVLRGGGLAPVHLALTVARDRIFCQARDPEVTFLVNGVVEANTVLREGDLLSLGDYEFTVTGGAPVSAGRSADGRPDESGGLPEIVHPPHRQSTIERHHRRARETRESRQLVRHLDLMYELAQLVNTVHDSAAFGDDLLRLVLGVVPAERAYLVQFHTDGSMEVLAARFADSAPAWRTPSQTILTRVRDQGISLITTDAAGDPRLDKSESIALAAITGAICVPMVHGEQILGGIYADGAGSVQELTRDHLTVLESVASFAAVALHRATLHRALEQRELHTHLLVHDMKNPLATLTSGLDLLQHQVGTLDPVLAETVAMIQRAGRQLDGYVSDILRVAQLEHGILEPNRRPTLLSRFCEEVHERWAPTLHFQKRELRCQVGPPDASFSLDVELMLRVLDNLLSNAVEHSPRGSTVGLSLRIDRGQLQLMVHDQGPGVQPEARKRIFAKYGRAEERAVGGRGFGLYFCRLAVRAHGGTIEVQGGPGDNRFVCQIPDEYS